MMRLIAAYLYQQVITDIHLDSLLLYHYVLLQVLVYAELCCFNIELVLCTLNSCGHWHLYTCLCGIQLTLTRIEWGHFESYHNDSHGIRNTLLLVAWNLVTPHYKILPCSRTIWGTNFIFYAKQVEVFVHRTFKPGPSTLFGWENMV